MAEACSAAGHSPAWQSTEAPMAESWDAATATTLAFSRAFFPELSSPNRRDRDLRQPDTEF